MTVLRIYQADELGGDGYPYAWHSVEGGPGIKHLIRAEAEHRCVRCAHPYEHGAGEWSFCDAQCHHDGPVRTIATTSGEAMLEAQWRILTVHHLNRVKADCRWWNLVALCQRCHLSVQTRVVMEQIWPLEHSEWMKPYAAGYYASTYLGVELFRPETLRRLDELLSLERVA